MEKEILTQEQIQKKYKDIYIDVYRFHDWESGELRFKVRGKSKVIKENMSLGQDVGTSMAYRR